MGNSTNPPRNGEGDRAEHGGGGPRILQTPIKQVKRARRLRRRLSLPEVLLLKALRRRLDGLKFRSQFPIGPIIVDFACLSHRLSRWTESRIVAAINPNAMPLGTSF